MMCILILSEPVAFSLHGVLATEKLSILKSRSPGYQESSILVSQVFPKKSDRGS